jgi:hypothetical protein
VGQELDFRVMAALSVAPASGSLHTTQLGPFIPNIADDFGQAASDSGDDGGARPVSRIPPVWPRIGLFWEPN